MGSLDSILVKQGNARSVSTTVLDDTPVAIRLKYLGTGSVTTVALTTATALVLTTSDGSAETFTFSTYTNMGLLVDKINASTYWEAKLLDALRTDETTNTDFVQNLTTTISSAGFYDCLVNTDTAQNVDNEFVYTCRCTIDRDPGSEKPKGSRRVKLSEVLYNVNVNGAEAKGFQIFEWDAAKKTETIVYQKVSVDATATTVNFASGNKTLDAGFGNDLIVRVKDTTSITDADGNYLICSYDRE